jgi:hypothetical protein
MNLRRMNVEPARVLGHVKIRIPDLRQKIAAASPAAGASASASPGAVTSTCASSSSTNRPPRLRWKTPKVLDLVKEMRDQDPTIVMISHNLAHVLDLSDRISVMKTGWSAASPSPRSPAKRSFRSSRWERMPRLSDGGERR